MLRRSEQLMSVMRFYHFVRILSNLAQYFSNVSSRSSRWVFIWAQFFVLELHDSVGKKRRLNVLPRKLSCPLKNGNWMDSTFLLNWALLNGDMLVFASSTLTLKSFEYHVNSFVLGSKLPLFPYNRG